MKKIIIFIIIAIFLPFRLSSARSLKKYFNKKTKAVMSVSKAPNVLKSVAIVPFEGESLVIGNSFADIFFKELEKTQLLKLIQNSTSFNHFKEMWLTEKKMTLGNYLVLAEKIGADAIFTGKIDEYRSIPENNYAYPKIALTVSFIDVKTGELIFKIFHEEYAKSSKITLHMLSEKVIHDIVSSIYFGWKDLETFQNLPSLSGNDAHVSGIKARPPRNFNLSDRGLREVIISWSAPYDNPSSYVIERSFKPDGPFKKIKKISPSKEIYHDKGSFRKKLHDNQTLYYRMYALYSKGIKSKATEIKKSITAPPPNPPENIKAEPNMSRGILLTWMPPDPSGEYFYVIERKSASELTPFKEIEKIKHKTYYQDGGYKGTSLKDSTEYLYQIKTVNKVDSLGPPSDPILVKTMPPPSKVKDFSAGSDQLRCIPLSWEPSSENNISGYILFKSENETGPFKKIADIKSNLKTDFLDGHSNPGNLKDDTIYYYRINSINTVGALGVDSDTVKARTRSVPPKVENFKAEKNEPRQITLSWEISTDSMVTGYYIYRTEGNAPFKKIAAIKGLNSTSYVDRGGISQKSKNLGNLKDGHAYEYKIYALNAAGALSYESTTAIGETLAAPSPPENIQANVNDSNIVVIMWKPNAEIKKYIIESSRGRKGKYKYKGEVVNDNKSDYLFFNDKKTYSGEIMSYRIKCVDRHGISGKWSKEYSVNIPIEIKL